VNESSVSANILEVEKPVLARCGINPRTLVRAVNRGVTLSHHGLPLVWAINILGALNDLPARRYATGGMEDVVVLATLVELRSLAGLMLLVTIEDDA
jgi:hypothetical protein